jgi:hypothetical protein
MRIGTDAGKREFGHIGFGDDHRAGGTQPLHRDGVGRGGRRLFGEDLRAGAGRLTRDIEQILDAHKRAVERAEAGAARGADIGRIGRGAGVVGIDREASPRALAVRIGNARKRLFKSVAAGETVHRGTRGSLRSGIYTRH